MRIIKLFLSIIAIICVTSIQAKDTNNKVYMFGFASSFNDSVVYFTDIQTIDSAYINKSGFLFGRENYSLQLNHYLQSQGLNTPTCITVFADNRKKIEKKILALKKKYTKKSKYDIQFIETKNFQYQAQIPTENDIQSEKIAKEKLKAQNKAAKLAKKEAKRKQKLAEKGILVDKQSTTNSTK